MGIQEKHYGNLTFQNLADEIDRCVEEMSILGYSIVENILTEDELVLMRNSLDRIYEQQEAELGRDYLAKIGELYSARMPLAYDDLFLRLATHPKIIPLIERMLGNYFILNLQNANICLPDQEHHQSAWHRDLPYQNFVISQPIAINALFCIDDCNEETGGTVVLPYSHKLEALPSLEYIRKHQVAPDVKAGSVIMFDSMLVHKAGYNSADSPRRIVNHIFTRPILKQQYNIPVMLAGKFSEDPSLRRLLGYDTQEPPSVKSWRENRYRKLFCNS